MKSQIIVVAAMVAAASPALAGRAIVFPLTGAGLPAEHSGIPEVMTRALARSVDATIGSVPLEDVAGLLACDAEATACLTAVARSVKAQRLVFGTITARGEDRFAVSLTRFDTGPERREHTFVVTGRTDDELARAVVDGAAPLFSADGSRETPPPEPIGSVEIEPAPAAVERDPRDAARGGGTTLTTWLVLGGGVAVAGVGTGLLVSAGRIRDQITTAPTETSADFEHLNALEDRGRVRTRIGWALVATGAVALAIGGVRALFEHRRPARPEERTTRLDPVVLPGGAGLVLTVTVP